MKSLQNIFLVLVVAVMTSCGGGGGGNGGDSGGGAVTGNVPSDLYGKWIYVDTTEEVELLSTTTLPTYEILSSNVLKVGSRHLLRASVTNTPISGKVLGDTTKTKSGQKAFTGIGGIDVILENVSDPSVKTSTTTDADGNFVDSSLPSGVYTIIGDDGNGGTFTSSVTINGTSTNLGNFSIDNNGYNFKTELILNQFFAYGDGTTYTGVVRMHNTGVNEGVGLAYDVTMSDYYLKDFTADITLGTVPAGTYKDIPVSFSFNELNVAKRTVTINTNIRDVNGNSWADDFEFTIYRRSMPINLTADSATVKGYVVIAGNLLIPFDTTNTTINIPVDPETPIYVMMANADIETETAYSIGIDTPSASTAGFNNPPVFEPNNNETEATTLALGASEVAYLHKGDLDYYVIDQTEEAQTLKAFSIPVTTDAPLAAGNIGAVVDLANYLYEGESAVVTSTAGTLYKNGVLASSGDTFVATDNLSLAFDTLSCGQTETSLLTIGGQDFEYTIQSRPCQLLSAAEYNFDMMVTETQTITLDFEDAVVVDLLPSKFSNYITVSGNTITISPEYDDYGKDSIRFLASSIGSKLPTDISIYISLNIKRSKIDTNVSSAGSPITMQVVTPAATANVVGVKSQSGVSTTMSYTENSGRWSYAIVIKNKLYLFYAQEWFSDKLGVETHYGEVIDLVTGVKGNIKPHPGALNGGSKVLKLSNEIVAVQEDRDTKVIDMYIYSPELDEWREVAAPDAYSSSALFEYKAQLYRLGGLFNDPILGSTRLSTAEYFDSAANKWSAMSTMPYGLSISDHCVMDDKLYAFGKDDSNVDRFVAYDFTSSTWASLTAFTTGRLLEGVACTNGKIFIRGAEYNLGTDTWVYRSPTLEEPASTKTITTYMDGKMFVFNGEVYAAFNAGYQEAAPDGVLVTRYDSMGIQKYSEQTNSWNIAVFNTTGDVGGAYRNTLTFTTDEEIMQVGGYWNWRYQLLFDGVLSTQYYAVYPTVTKFQRHRLHDFVPTINSSVKLSDNLYEIQFTDLDTTVEHIDYKVEGDRSFDSHVITTQ